jgi:nucleotide-binding universal stress UspA family protein
VFRATAVRLAIASTGALFDAVRDDGERIVRDAVALARAVQENVSIMTDMPTEPPVPLLAELSREARMVVIGPTGTGGFTGMLLGSTAAAVVSHARCPVLVIRSRHGARLHQPGTRAARAEGCPLLVMRPSR